MSITAKYAGTCNKCHKAINPGDEINWSATTRVTSHVACPVDVPQWTPQEQRILDVAQTVPVSQILDIKARIAHLPQFANLCEELQTIWVRRDAETRAAQVRKVSQSTWR